MNRTLKIKPGIVGREIDKNERSRVCWEIMATLIICVNFCLVGGGGILIIAHLIERELLPKWIFALDGFPFILSFVLFWMIILVATYPQTPKVWQIADYRKALVFLNPIALVTYWPVLILWKAGRGATRHILRLVSNS